jgi:hypothetical protein
VAPPLHRTLLLRDEMRLWAPSYGSLTKYMPHAFAAVVATYLVVPVIAVVAPVIAGTAAAQSYRVLRQSRRHFRGRPVIDFGTLPDADHAPVHVRGRVRARTLLRGLLTDREAVARRVDVRIGSWSYVHVAAQEFDLVDGTGRALPLAIGPSTLLWLPHAGRLWPITAAQRARLEELRATIVLPPIPVTAAESLLQDGDEIEVVGALSRDADAEGSALGRDAFRRTLVAGTTQLMIRAVG